MSYYKIIGHLVELTFFVKINAKRTALIDINASQGVVIALHAKPVQGEANKELIRYLSELYNIPKTSIHFKRGQHSRHKVLCMPFNSRVQTMIQDPSQFIKLH